MNDHHHVREVCEGCGKVLVQCRCIEPKVDTPKGFCHDCQQNPQGQDAVKWIREYAAKNMYKDVCDCCDQYRDDCIGFQFALGQSGVNGYIGSISAAHLLENKNLLAALTTALND